MGPSQSARKSKQEATKLENSDFTDAFTEGTLLSKLELAPKLNSFKLNASDLGDFAAGRKLAARACGEKSGHSFDDKGGKRTIVDTNEHGRTRRQSLLRTKRQAAAWVSIFQEEQG